MSCRTSNIYSYNYYAAFTAVSMNSQAIMTKTAAVTIIHPCSILCSQYFIYLVRTSFKQAVIPEDLDLKAFDSSPSKFNTISKYMYDLDFINLQFINIWTLISSICNSSIFDFVFAQGSKIHPDCSSETWNMQYDFQLLFYYYTIFGCRFETYTRHSCGSV